MIFALRRQWFVAVSAFAISLLYRSFALAAVPVELRFDDGVTLVKRDAVRRLIELELRDSLDAKPTAGITLVNVRAVQSSLVRIEIDDAVTGKSVARTVDLKALGNNGATRLLAVAIVELLSASWSELQTNPAPVVPPATPAASPEARREAQTTMRKLGNKRTQISAMAVARGPFKEVGVTLGAGIRYVPSLTHHLVLPVDVTFEHTSQDTALGSVGIDVLAADVGLAWQSTGTTIAFRAGGGARGGAVRYAGSANDDALARANTVWAPWASPVASFSVIVTPTSALIAELIVEGGYAVASTRARIEPGPDIALSGAWGGVALAFGARIEQ